MLYEKIKSILGSKKFLIFIFVWFVFQAGWMMVSNRPSAPHDERSHIYSIREFSESRDPFLSIDEIENPQYFGLTYSSSYLYYYLFSLPYKVIVAVTGEPTYQLMFMRSLNLIISIVGFYILYLAINLITKKNKAKTNLIMFAMSCTTVYVYTSGGVSYDNLQFLLIFFVYYLFTKFYREKNIVIAGALFFASASAVAVKYTSLTLVTPLILIAVWRLITDRELYIKQLRHRSASRKGFTQSLLVVVFILMCGIILYKPALNVVKYGSPDPSCQKVLTLEMCMANGIYARNIALEEDNKNGSRVNLYSFFVNTWTIQMRRTIFGVYNSAVSKRDTLLLMYLANTIMIVTPLLIYSVKKKVFPNDEKGILLLLSLFYVLVLLIKNFSTYTRVGVPLALQGRYLLPVLPLLYLIIIEVYTGVIKDKLKRAIVLLVVLPVLLTGGVVTYIQLTDETWYLNDKRVEAVNNASKKALSPLDFIIVEED